MLIIKKYHDYYDSAISAGGIDKTCIYQRDQIQVVNKYELENIINVFEGTKIGRNDGPYKYDWRYHKYNTDYKSPKCVLPFVIGFCGKTYVGYYFMWQNNLNDVEKTEIVYGPDEFFDKHHFDIKEKYYKYYKGKEDQERTRLYFEQFHNKTHTELFIKYNTPTFVFDFGTELVYFDKVNDLGLGKHNNHFIVNPPLKHYKFFKLFNSQMAFQEIQMFLQGVLGNKEKPIVDVSEKNKLLQHGFDPVWSFRNPCPPNRKMGKCKI